MNVHEVIDSSDPNHFVNPGNIAVSPNAVELKTAGLNSCCALIILQYPIYILCHVNDQISHDEMLDVIRDKIDLSSKFGVSFAVGCQQNSWQDTQGTIDRVSSELGCQTTYLGQVANSTDHVSTNLTIMPFRALSVQSPFVTSFDL